MSNWYADSRDAIQRTYGDDWRLFAGLLAATSSHTQLAANVTLAKKAYHHVKATGSVPATGFLTVHRQNILHYLAAGQLRGQKVQAFYDALLGDEDSVVIDLWMTRRFRQTDNAPTPKQYRELAETIRISAGLSGLTPAQEQARLWAETRKDKRSYADYLAQLRLF